ncbi:hypothetical protein EDB85DRAFT_1889898 [Lactarius pseudohatsudake]|nr:hypothetical protein EDB85DRAFT_1889898 [Lactarius pseudohatsudake]
MWVEETLVEPTFRINYYHLTSVANFEIFGMGKSETETSWRKAGKDHPKIRELQTIGHSFVTKSHLTAHRTQTVKWHTRLSGLPASGNHRLTPKHPVSASTFRFITAGTYSTTLYSRHSSTGVITWCLPRRAWRAEVRRRRDRSHVPVRNRRERVADGAENTIPRLGVLVDRQRQPAAAVCRRDGGGNTVVPGIDEPKSIRVRRDKLGDLLLGQSACVLVVWLERKVMVVPTGGDRGSSQFAGDVRFWLGSALREKAVGSRLSEASSEKLQNNSKLVNSPSTPSIQTARVRVEICNDLKMVDVHRFPRGMRNKGAHDTLYVLVTQGTPIRYRNFKKQNPSEGKYSHVVRLVRKTKASQRLALVTEISYHDSIFSGPVLVLKDPLSPFPRPLKRLVDERRNNEFQISCLGNRAQLRSYAVGKEKSGGPTNRCELRFQSGFLDHQMEGVGTIQAICISIATPN